jgi:hypothetical protein
MNLDEKVNLLYEKDSSETYQNLLELECLSESENVLYDYFDTFLEMMRSGKYIIRVRGYRLLCKQAKWDIDNRIDESIADILLNLEDERPTAVRQKIAAIQDVIKHKKELNEKIRTRLLEIEDLKFKDTMQPLIQKDIHKAIDLIDRNVYEGVCEQ